MGFIVLTLDGIKEKTLINVSLIVSVRKDGCVAAIDTSDGRRLFVIESYESIVNKLHEMSGVYNVQ